MGTKSDLTLKAKAGPPKKVKKLLEGKRRENAMKMHDTAVGAGGATNRSENEQKIVSEGGRRKKEKAKKLKKNKKLDMPATSVGAERFNPSACGNIEEVVISTGEDDAKEKPKKMKKKKKMKVPHNTVAEADSAKPAERDEDQARSAFEAGSAKMENPKKLKKRKKKIQVDDAAVEVESASPAERGEEEEQARTVGGSGKKENPEKLKMKKKKVANDLVVEGDGVKPAEQVISNDGSVKIEKVKKLKKLKMLRKKKKKKEKEKNIQDDVAGVDNVKPADSNLASEKVVALVKKSQRSLDNPVAKGDGMTDIAASNTSNAKEGSDCDSDEANASADENMKQKSKEAIDKTVSDNRVEEGNENVSATKTKSGNSRHSLSGNSLNSNLDSAAVSQGTRKRRHSDGGEHLRPFKRVREGDVVFKHDELRDNSFFTKNDTYGEKAHRDLVVTRGKGFRKEKTKKKRLSHHGGKLTNQVNSFKFPDDDSD